MSFSFHAKPYRLPLKAPLRTAHGLWQEREGLLVRLEAADGRVGFGEIAPIPWFGTETLPEALEICGKLGDKVPADVLAVVPERMGCVRFALAEALRQSSGQALEEGRRVPLTALLPAGRGATEVLLARLEAGWLSFKWKVGVGDIDEELGLLDELIERLPAYTKLRLDANGAWTRRQAARWLERCAERPVEFVEQPVAPADEDSLMGLAQDFPVTLALDESVVRLAQARVWQARGWPGVFVIKPALAGPLDDTISWAIETKADVVWSSAIETALGRAAILRGIFGADPAVLQRSPGFGVGELFGDRRWDGPFTGPLLDGEWMTGVNPAEMWGNLP
ncbi:L-Ala-D/L-Glu epimerase [Lacunisphaera limnophila]|uniref:o-succinylbenzoate synthase n=1 Tax=Lacunisphaera limnophila TaxID=1838286 RepID=A0A1D8AY57_9BACT|nr:o-succinylbenzoate synthase [Lacunisphaera limnophila]AOS45808.1 L-Ala-D/L-Glu epimerase [Lacunisphaera limnophila]